MRRMYECMGTVASLDIPGCEEQAVFDDVFDRLKAIENRFSTYIPHSEISQFRSGEIVEAELSDELQRVLAACKSYEAKTDGYFSAYFDGTCNPTGYVKGWAIAEVARLLESKSIDTFLINIGGDILAQSNRPDFWKVGLQHPLDAQKTFGTLSVDSIAVATSGTYERGKHIINPHSQDAALEVVGTTVFGPNIIDADVYATAVCAMGVQTGVDFINRHAGYNALLIRNDGALFVSDGLKKQTAQK